MRDLVAELADLEQQGLRRHRRVLESRQGARVRVDGREYLSFCSNDYLGLAADPRIAEVAAESIRQFGLGAGASHLLSGHHRTHDDLERALAGFAGLPRALLFSSGYLANLAVVTVLAGRSSDIFADRLNHASLNDAMILSRARCKRYPHCDPTALEAFLMRSRAADKLVITDAVFSMDGDIAPLSDIARLCERFGAWLVVDDAHGFGVLGKSGGGALAHFGLDSPHIAYVGTLGKAAGVSGAFVAGSEQLIELLIQRARTYIYTTASPPPLAAALMKSVELMRAEAWRRQRLIELSARISGTLELRKWRLLSSQTAIQPLIVGENSEAVALSAAMANEGILVPAIRPPTVSKGSSRLRISLSAAHTEADVDLLVTLLRQLEPSLS
ncbi:MAG: 8-amino-7-oxononanoate synthase [Betaproteobacteria bacterium]|nr:8-amino-7-oxononanoate synthase [Betaproteobacteria bacterium]